MNMINEIIPNPKRCFFYYNNAFSNHECHVMNVMISTTQLTCIQATLSMLIKYTLSILLKLKACKSTSYNCNTNMHTTCRHIDKVIEFILELFDYRI